MRFSLAKFFLLILFVALIFALWSTSRDLREAKLELQQSREELGFLAITDASRIYAAAASNHHLLEWRWRIYLPKKAGLKLHWRTSNVPLSGIPGPTAKDSDDAGDSLLRKGENLLDARVQKNSNGEWVLELKTSDLRGSNWTWWPLIDKKNTTWLDHLGHHYAWSNTGVKERTSVSASSDQPLVLLRLRVDLVFSKVTKQMERAASTDPCDGLMLWIGK